MQPVRKPYDPSELRPGPRRLDTLNAVIQVDEGPAPKVAFFIVPAQSPDCGTQDADVDTEMLSYVRMDALSPETRELIKRELGLKRGS